MARTAAQQMADGDFTRAELERFGFRGFVPVRDLLAQRPVARGAR